MKHIFQLVSDLQNNLFQGQCGEDGTCLVCTALEVMLMLSRSTRGHPFDLPYVPVWQFIAP